MQNNRIFLFLLLAFCICFASCEGVAAETSQAEDDFIAELTFLGDSTTAHMKSRAPIRNEKQIFATKARYLNLDTKIAQVKIEDPETGEEILISAALEKYRPRYLFLTLGIDYGVYYYRDDQETFGLCYEKLLTVAANASPDTRIILGAIFPVGRNCKVISNEMVDRANLTIQAIAEEHGLPYVDNNTILKDSEGFLAEKYCYSEDGIHLTASAYEIIFQNLEALAPALR